MQKETTIQELKSKINTILEPMIYEVEAGAIRRFCEAVDDQNPLYWDGEYARRTKYRGIIAPPGFYGLPLEKVSDAEDNVDLGILLGPVFRSLPQIPQLGRSGVNGGTEMEFFYQVRPGDILLTYYKLTDIIEKQGKLGEMMLCTIEQTFKNKAGQTVAVVRTTLIMY